ncbi:MAG: hypothetical protein VX632_00545, partial [Chloroflexota bacterium]|nr:hypothetical protein [Chloroflexota bacterium]
ENQSLPLVSETGGVTPSVVSSSNSILPTGKFAQHRHWRSLRTYPAPEKISVVVNLDGILHPPTLQGQRAKEFG